MVIVQLCAFGRDGDSLYRIHEPARALAALPGVTVADVHLLSRHAFALARRADLLILHFANDWGLADLVRDRRAAGRPTVFEANDDFFDLQPWNPIAPAWADPAVPALYRHLLRTADAVQTSTEALADRWRAMGARRVAVFDNHLAEPQPRLAPPGQPGPGRPLTLGWAGSPGHFADLYWVAPTLLRWLDAHPDARLALMTGESARAFVPLPADRLVFRPFGTRADYLAFLDGLDIGFAPLLPTAYNRGRSDVKHLEYAARGVPGLYSDVGPYRARIRPGETGLLFADLAGFAAGLDRLAGDAALRDAIRERAHAAALRERRLPDHVPERLAWYQGLIAAAGAARGHGLHRLPGYHAVDLEPAEAVLARPAEAAEAADLDALLVAVPDHRAAALRRVRLPRGTSVSARALLETVQASHPDDSEIAAEHARALYREGALAAARAGLDAVLAQQPASLTAWRYRLRLAAQAGETDTQALAEAAVAAQPESGEIALLAATLLPHPARVAALAAAIERHRSALPALERPGFAAHLAGILKAFAPVTVRRELLAQALAAFPDSAELVVANGEALRQVGHEAEGLAEERRALLLTSSIMDGPPSETALRSRLAAHILAALA